LRWATRNSKDVLKSRSGLFGPADIVIFAVDLMLSQSRSAGVNYETDRVSLAACAVSVLLFNPSGAEQKVVRSWARLSAGSGQVLEGSWSRAGTWNALSICEEEDRNVMLALLPVSGSILE
jgi:hypothetical protein